ncbi:MAG: hypothetical protein IOC82_02565 [Aestuariivirga sp.]|uniref:hypothetical protein n=1 Tax=Aestuariivirga sp. TaxID=2650926 RepID=UPI0025BD40AA|nr:hypothetical protein [Aestuariivirga sp.]MCA3559896.1 hypothetical protein [Aestuariivirga sp.]
MALNAHKGAVDLLLKILETRSARMTGSVMRASFGEASTILMESGLLLNVGRAETVASMDDFEDEPTRVEWSAEQGSIGYYANNGRWVEVSAEELAIYGVAMPTFLTQLLVRCERIAEGGKEPLVPDVVWDLGTVWLHGRGKPVSVWFARRLSDTRHRGALENMAARRPPADLRVVMTPTADCPNLDLIGHVLVSLRDVLEAPDRIVVEPAILAKRLKQVPTSLLKPIQHSPDYGMIYIGEESYPFRGPQHRAILKILVDAYNDNDPVRLTADILEEIKPGPKVTNLARAFSGNRHWQKFIKEEAGQCWIEI